jgi:hypothetical protein
MAAQAIQTCQWENTPVGIAKAPAILRSEARRQSPSTEAITAAGVNNELKASAALRFFPFLR